MQLSFALALSELIAEGLVSLFAGRKNFDSIHFDSYRDEVYAKTFDLTETFNLFDLSAQTTFENISEVIDVINEHIIRVYEHASSYPIAEAKIGLKSWLEASTEMLAVLKKSETLILSKVYHEDFNIQGPSLGVYLLRNRDYFVSSDPT
jgi:hypothetical protein